MTDLLGIFFGGAAKTGRGSHFFNRSRAYNDIISLKNAKLIIIKRSVIWFCLKTIIGEDFKKSFFAFFPLFFRLNFPLQFQEADLKRRKNRKSARNKV